MTLQGATEQEAQVLAAVREARSRPRSIDVIDGVKTAVADELTRLDPTLKIKKTDYFNHSYIPDIVATWRENGKPQERRVFIRGSLRAVVAAEDVEALSDQHPLLIGLGDEKGPSLRNLRAQMPKTTRTLATDVGVTSRILTRERLQTEGQLSELVLANIIRGGRGLLTSSDADRIAAVEDHEPIDALKAFQRTVKKLFVGVTAERLTRTAGLLGTFFEEQPSTEALAQLQEQPLSDSELQVVLPFVLRRATEVRSAAVWETLASMLTLERIESLSPMLADLDLTPLIRPAVNSLTAGRSALFINADELSDEEKDDLSPSWRVRNGKLMADVHRWTLWMGSDGRKLRGREDGPDARWDELTEPLQAFDLSAIALHGLSRQLGVANVNADAVREDVELFRRAIEDDFHVASVTIREKGEVDSPEVTVEFGAGTATGKAPVAFHVRAAALLAVKRPLAPGDIETLTAKPE